MMGSSRGHAMRRFVVHAAMLLALSACYEEDDQTLPSTTTDKPAVAQDAHWLEVDDPRSPVAFLASQSGIAEAILAPRLQALSAHYRESPRMIANRVLQLWQEYPDQPMDGLMTDLVPADGRAEESLGPVVQQYRVLRANGVDHADAMAKITGRTP